MPPQAAGRTADVLGQLPDTTWTIRHGLIAREGCPVIDHLVIGPGGIFAIHDKDWSGAVKVTQNSLRLNGKTREEVVADATEVAAMLRHLLPRHIARTVHPVLCFDREEGLSGWADDVMICSTLTLPYLLQSRPPLLSAPQVEDAAAVLGHRLKPAPREAVAPERVKKSVTELVKSSTGAPKRRKEKTTGVAAVVARLAAVMAVLLLSLMFGPELAAAVGL